ncbi:MAG: cyclase family protein [Thermoplasmata archaeon]
MRFIDVSMALGPDTPIYPGDSPFSKLDVRRMEGGDRLNLSEIRMGAHTGTHVDAPRHFIRGGKGIDDLPADAFSGPATVLDLSQVVDSITREDIAGSDIREGDVVLLRTRNSDRLGPVFHEDYVYLSEAGAQHFVGLGVKAVGIDYLSIEGFGVRGFPVHRLLLEEDIGIIEGLDLSRVEAGRYWLLCLPMKVGGGDGAPARAVLVEGWPEM